MENVESKSSQSNGIIKKWDVAVVFTDLLKPKHQHETTTLTKIFRMLLPYRPRNRDVVVDGIVTSTTCCTT